MIKKYQPLFTKPEELNAKFFRLVSELKKNGVAASREQVVGAQLSLGERWVQQMNRRDPSADLFTPEQAWIAALHFHGVMVGTLNFTEMNNTLQRAGLIEGDGE